MPGTLLTTDETFDAITSDRSTHGEGAATLYTKSSRARQSKRNRADRDTVCSVREHAEAVKSEIGTFFTVFPNGVIWGNTHQGAYDR